MDAYHTVNGCNEETNICCKDSDALTNYVDRSLDDSTYGSMNGYVDECLESPLCNGIVHSGKTVSDTHISQTRDILDHHAGSSELNLEDDGVSSCENGCHGSFSKGVTVGVRDHLPVKLKPLSPEAVNGNSSCELTDKESSGLESEGDHVEEAVEEPITIEPNTSIDYSYLELDTLPESLYSMPMTTELSLDYNDFTELPDTFFDRLSCLRVLSLIANNLTCLPESISRLSSLEELNVSQNSLRSLPPSIGTLDMLHSIDFSQNQISELPPEFGRLSRLEKIVGFGNLLLCLPQTFGRLENLVSVDLSGNQLKVLSHSFGFLVQMRSLNLSSNGLDHLPESVTCLSMLECLDVSDNVLTCLPDKLQCLQRLRQLYVSNNQLRLLPAWIEHLPALEELRLEKNQLTGSPLSDTLASNCRRLRVLNLGRNLIRNITNSIVGLENLEWLDLGNGEDGCTESTTRSIASSTVYNWIWQLPPFLDSLRRLRHLNLYAIRLEELPDAFGYLANLEWLNLGANELHDLPQSFGQLTSLKYLVLSMNELELLPSNFGSLSKLEELRLDRNRLAELPQSFCCLCRLHHLDLFSNRLTELPLFLQGFTQLKSVNLDENCFKGSLPITINGTQIMVVKRRTSPTGHRCTETDSLENIAWDETNGNSLEREVRTEEDISGRPNSFSSTSSCGSQARVSPTARSEKEEEEEDWDRELLENSPFIDSEPPPGNSSKDKMPVNCCCNDARPPFVSFVPAAWHAPRVNTFHANTRQSPSPFAPFSNPTFNSVQFEDADEESS